MGDQHFQYFTLDEDSEVEEYVADDPNIKRKIFWYNLLEQTIQSNSRLQLVIHAIISLFGYLLQIKLLCAYTDYHDWKYFSWTISALLFTGGMNLISLHNSRRADTSEDADVNRKNGNQAAPAANQHSQKLRTKVNRASKWYKIVQVIRQFSIFALLSPVFNLICSWNGALRHETELKRPLIMRNQPQPTKHEISSMKHIWDKSVKKSQVDLVETMLRLFSLGLLQIFILVCYRDNLQDDTREAQVYLISWNILCLAWTCTIYANAHFNYTKTLQFEDLKDNDINMLFVQVTTANTGFYLLHNIISILFRIYCIAVLLDTIHYWTFLFITVVYIIFNSIVPIMSTRCRLRYENPPKGLSTTASDLISRWFNIFCSYNLKQEGFIHFTYIFSILYAIPRITYLYINWSSASGLTTASGNFSQDFSDVQDEEEYYQELKFNTTRFQFASECISGLEESKIWHVPLFSWLVYHFIHLIVLITDNCSTHFHHLQSDFTVILLFILHCTTSFVYLAKLKNRILFENEFPAQEAYKYWSKWLTKDWIINDTYEIKKIILCLISSDDEIEDIRKLSQEYRRSDGKVNASCKCIVHGIGIFCCCRHFSRRNNGTMMTTTLSDEDINSLSKLQVLINVIWKKYVEKTPGLSSNEDGSNKLYHLLERRNVMAGVQRGRNSCLSSSPSCHCCDVQINNLLEFLLENFVLEDDVIRLLIIFIEKFDDYIVNTSNSYRLANIENILN